MTPTHVATKKENSIHPPCLVQTTMMKAVVLACLVAVSAAFAPAQQSRASFSLNEFCNGYVGGEGPEPMFIGAEGSKNFDPAGFCEVR